MNRSTYCTLPLVAVLVLAGGCQGDAAPAANTCTSMSAFAVPLQPRIQQREDSQPQHGRPNLEITFRDQRCEPQAPRIDRLIPPELMMQ